MRLTRTVWLVLGIGIFVAATAVLYFMYQGRVDERQKAKDALQLVEEQQLPGLMESKQALEDELAQKEDEIAQWEEDMIRLEELLDQAKLNISQVQEGFPASIAGISYDEALFSFADDSNIKVTGLNSSEPIPVEVNGNNYETTVFNLKVRGELADILDFINIIVTDEAFATAVMEPVNLSIPEPLTDEQIEDMKETLEKEIMLAAVGEITTQQMLDYILEAIAEVTGRDDIDPRLAEDMAKTIKSRIDELLLEGDYNDILAGRLAEFIVEYITNSVISEVVNPLAVAIGELIMPIDEIVEGEEGEEDETIYDDEALEELLGPSIAEMLGPQIAGATSGEIAGILNEFIAELVEAKMENSVAETVEAAVNEIVAQQIEEYKESTADIELVVYAYQGEEE